MKAVAALLAGLIAFGAGSASAQDDPMSTALAAMAQLEAATTALGEAEGSGDRVAALTETVRAYETGLTALREGLRQIALREAAIRGVFDAESDRLGQLLGVLQAIEAAPEPHLLLHPDGPLGTVRAGMILSDVTPALAREAETLRAGLEELALLRELQEAAVSTLEDGLQSVQAARTELSQAVSNRTDLPRRYIADDAALQSLITSADTLESFASGLMSATISTGDTPDAPADFMAAHGTLDMPLIGRVIRRYDEADAAGIRRPGWVIATRPLSLVTTPFPVTIRYLGPLLDYGQVAVLEPAEGWLIVLAGMGQLFGELGDVLPAGTPIGMMPGAAPADSQAFLISSPEGGGAEATETLYMELRQNGEPVNPQGWFAGQSD